MGAPAARRRTVSGAVSLPSRGAFHLSLAVLVRYRSWESAQPWRGVPPASGRVSRARPYSGTWSRSPRGSAYGALTRCGRPSHAVPLPCGFVTPAGGPRPPAAMPRNPRAATPSGCALARVWAVPVSLAATPGVSFDFLSSGYLDVSVPPVAAPGLIYSVPGQVGTTPPGFPHSGIRGSGAVCASPRLIAACHALRRLPMPRHPPCALGIFSQRPRGPDVPAGFRRSTPRPRGRGVHRRRK